MPRILACSRVLCAVLLLGAVESTVAQTTELPARPTALSVTFLERKRIGSADRRGVGDLPGCGRRGLPAQRQCVCIRCGHRTRARVRLHGCAPQLVRQAGRRAGRVWAGGRPDASRPMIRSACSILRARASTCSRLRVFTRARSGCPTRMKASTCRSCRHPRGGIVSAQGDPGGRRECGLAALQRDDHDRPRCRKHVRCRSCRRAGPVSL